MGTAFNLIKFLLLFIIYINLNIYLLHLGQQLCKEVSQIRENNSLNYLFSNKHIYKLIYCINKIK